MSTCTRHVGVCGYSYHINNTSLIGQCCMEKNCHATKSNGITMHVHYAEQFRRAVIRVPHLLVCLRCVHTTCILYVYKHVNM